MVKTGLPLLPVVGVCGADGPNAPVGVWGVPPPKLNPKPCCTAGDVASPAPEPNPNGLDAGCCGGALVGPPKENGADDVGARDCVPKAGLAGADPNPLPLTDEPNVKGVAVAGVWA